ncbi:hypothetical protein CapIbe_017839 [Capra ibex]
MVRYAPLLARKGPDAARRPSWRAIMMLPANHPASKNRWRLTFSLNSTLISFDEEQQRWLQVNFQRDWTSHLPKRLFFSKRPVCAPWVQPSFLRQSPFALNPGEGSRTLEPQEEEMALSEL